MSGPNPEMDLSLYAESAEQDYNLSYTESATNTNLYV